jgi:hypothetical protein
VTRDTRDNEIFFHVGLGRAASTYLQYRVFPKLEGIRYIHRNRYRAFSKLIERSRDTKYLISREAARRLNDRLREFAEYRRDGKVILVLRRHDQWIASHYRRYVKNGGSYSFNRFLDLDGDHPVLWGRDDLEFMTMIRSAEHYFDSPPLVLFQEELTNSMERFIARLTAFTGTTCDLSKINPNPIHRSYNTQRLKVVRKVGAFVFPPIPTHHSNPTLHRAQRRAHLILCHLILALARWIPASVVGDEPLILPEQLARVHDETAHDWESCLAFAAAHNPTPDQPTLS